MAYFYTGAGNPASEDAINSIILGTSLLTSLGISSMSGMHTARRATAQSG